MDFQIENNAAADGRRFRWPGSPLVDAVEIDAECGDLLALDADGVLSGLNLDTGEATRFASIGQPLLAGDQWRLHIDTDERFAAVVEDFGTAGVVVDLSTGDTVMRLDAGDYCVETVPASVVFVRHPSHGTVLVHRTDWNRIDATALPSGQCLTTRRPGDPAEADESSHYLDYFYGAIHASPQGRYLFCDGWVWQPAAAQYLIDLAAWLDGAVYQPEDDYLENDLAAVMGFGDEWTMPCVWLDDSHVALWCRRGPLPVDDERFAKHPADPVIAQSEGAVFILDVDAPHQASSASPGPTALRVPTTGRPEGFDWPVGRLFRCADLLAVYDGTVTSLWDWRTAQPVATIHDVQPHLLHQRRSSLIELHPDGVTETPLPRIDR
ncbi:hypothetical protein [Stackebrandtia soli]|uniref:hypothetical protein n=1 Tax=Stackebrandtia soli TaxID=1892856 RepID=UPI0039E87C40